MEASLATTNVFLGIMAFTSALEALLILGLGLAIYMLYRRMMEIYHEVMDLAKVVEAKHLSSTFARTNAILDDVKDVTATVRRNTDRVDAALHNSRIRLVGIARGARFALRAILRHA